jgi:tetratricopeptide (TPR) repeat protein
MAPELPDDIALRVEVAELFVTAGDTARALEQFQRALRLAPENPRALAGAAEAAFRLGNYALARTYLQRTPADSAAASKTRELVESVLSMDPLASRIGSSERRRRLVADFSYAEQRFERCIGLAGVPKTADIQTLHVDVQAFADQLKRTRLLEQEAVEAGTDLIDRVERHVTAQCGPPTVPDQALVLIGRLHGVAAQ